MERSNIWRKGVAFLARDEAKSLPFRTMSKRTAQIWYMRVENSVEKHGTQQAYVKYQTRDQYISIIQRLCGK